MSSNQSEGKFFNKLKNSFRKDSTSSSKSSDSKKSSSISKNQKDQVLKEAHDEGEQQYKQTHGTNAAGKTSATHENHVEHILKEAYHEGEKLFHIKHNTGKYSSVGGVAATSTGANQYAHRKTSSTSSENSKGRLVSTPPNRSRKPLDHEIPGDFTNEKQPTDPTVLGDTSAHPSKSSGVITNDHPHYSDGAKQASGEGRFFNPKDTQGGTLGAATSSSQGTNQYNERTKQNVHDFDNLKTQPTAYDQKQQQEQELEDLKQEAYKEGNRKGRNDIQSNPGLQGSQQIGGPTEGESVDASQIHHDNKSAYNKDGVSGILDKEGLTQQQQPKQHTTEQKEPQYDHFGQPITSAGVGSAATAHPVSHASHDPVSDQRRISDLDKQINQTDARIKELRNDPNNASTYAVTDEPIKTPKLANVHDDDDETFVDAATGQHFSSKNPNTSGRLPEDVANKEQYDSITQATKDHSNPGVLATATGAVAAAAGYLGFNKDQEAKDAADERIAKDQAYIAGHNQGTNNVKTTNTHPNDSTVTQAHAVGYQQGTKDASYDQGLNEGNKSSNNQAGHEYGQELYGEARHAVEAAGATVAGVFGYNQPKNAREGHRQLLEESYKVGQDKAHKDHGENEEGFLSSALGALGLSGKSAETSTTTSTSTNHHNYGDKVPRDESLTKPDGSYIGIPKQKEEIDRNPNKVPKDESLTKPDSSSSSSKGVLASAGAAAGAAVGGAYNYLKGNDDTSNTVNKNTTSAPRGEGYVHDSLIADAEKVDPSIDNYPAHRANQKELKNEESLGRNATPQEKHVVDSNNDKKWERETEDYDRKHGHGQQERDEDSERSTGVLPSAGAAASNAASSANNKVTGYDSSSKNTTTTRDASDYQVHDSLIADAEKDDPSIDKLPPHKTNKKELKEEETLSSDASEKEKETVASNDFKELEDDVAKWNKAHGFKNPKSSLIEVAEEADPSIDKFPAHKGVSIDKEDAGNSNEVSGDNVQPLPSGLPSGNHDEIKQNIGNSANVGNAAKKSSTADSYSDDKYEKASKQADNGGITGVTGESPHARDTSSKLSKDHDQLDKDLKKDAYKEGKHQGKEDYKSFDSNLKKQLYDHGYEKGLAHNKSTSSQDAAYNTTKPSGSQEYPLDRKPQDDAYSSHGTANAVPSGAGLVPGAAVGSSHTKEQVRREAHQVAQSDHQQSLDPTLKQQLYQHGYEKGKSSTGSSLDPTGYAGASSLDRKLKQDLYEHGHAKGSLEKKHERDSKVSNQPYGSSNREAAVIGDAGLGAASANQQHTGLHTPVNKKEELVDENEARNRNANNSKDNLVVEVIGIEDKEEALRTAKKASKKLDEKGVDLTSGKLVINANTKEIYKIDAQTNETITTPFDSDHHQQVAHQNAAAGAAGIAGSQHQHQSSNVLETYGQSRSAGYTQGLEDTSYTGEGVGKQTKVDPTTSGQVRAAGFTQGIHYTGYRGEGAGKQTQVDPYASGQSRTEGYSQGLEDSSYRGDGVGKTTELDPTHHNQTSRSAYDENEAAKQRLANAANRNVASSSGAAATSGSSNNGKSSNDEIFVNVKGIKDNAIATKIAETAVKRLQKSHANVVAKVKEIQVDANSGIVRDENGDEIAHYPDLAIDPSGSHKKTSSGDYSKQRTSYSTHQQSQGVSGGSNLAAAAATKASNEYSNPHEPKYKTQANEYTSSNTKAQPTYPQGVLSSNDHKSSGNTNTNTSGLAGGSSHLQGGNAYPSSAVSAAHDSSESSLDKNIHDVSNRHNQTSSSHPIENAGISASANQAATFGGSGQQDFQNAASGLNSQGGNKAATSNTTSTVYNDVTDEANTSTGSYMPGSWV
ncbi:unnamed protein product [Candida verbasci]|uniref:Uncharacterized protein n=1 Tax=Candida verbasci TaxID=1227364 RepID=A0A9W4X9M3_9ASCO|nr:unnamed protein product [Candida verbasci]